MKNSKVNDTKNAARKSSQNFDQNGCVPKLQSTKHCALFLPKVFSEFFALRLLRVDGPEADYAEDIRTAVLTASSIDQRYNRYNIHPYLYFA